MKIRIANADTHNRLLMIQSSAHINRFVRPLSFGERLRRASEIVDIGRHEIVVLRVFKGDDTGTLAKHDMPVRIANHGDIDLLMRDSITGTMHALEPLGFTARPWREYMEFILPFSGTVIIHARGAKDPDGIELRSPV